jgi:hypothetical protein
MAPSSFVLVTIYFMETGLRRFRGNQGETSRIEETDECASYRKSKFSGKCVYLELWMMERPAQRHIYYEAVFGVK